MPLFGRNKNATTASGSAGQPSATTASAPNAARNSRGFFASHRRSTSVSPTNSGRSSQHPQKAGNPIARAVRGLREDPSITAARQRVVGAEQAERNADRAMITARAAVRDARAEVARLEAEAAEDARLAKIKQGQAKDLGKRAKPLGRHGVI